VTDVDPASSATMAITASTKAPLASNMLTTGSNGRRRSTTAVFILDSFVYVPVQVVLARVVTGITNDAHIGHASVRRPVT
jgi:hypothetical protein